MLIPLPRRWPEASQATGVFGIGTADEPGEKCGVFCVLPGISEVDPEQPVELAGQLERLQLERQEAIGLGIEFEMFLDFPIHPFRIECGLRARDDGDAAVPNAGFALRFELAQAAFPFVQPDSQAMLLYQRASEYFDAGRVVVIVAEEKIKLSWRAVARQPSVY